MKILYLHQFFTTPQGSGGTRSFELGRRLVARGHEVTVVCGSLIGGKTGLDGPFSRGKREGMVAGIRVIEFELPYGNQHSFVRRTMAFLKYSLRVSLLALRHPADLVFATTPPLTVALPAMLCRLFTRKRIVCEVRDLWPESPRAMGVITNPLALSAMGLLETMLYKVGHRFVALAPGIIDGIVAKGRNQNEIMLVPNGSDMEANPSTLAPRLLDAKDTEMVALYAGTHGIANGLDAVLDAASVLKQRGRNDIKIVLCGDGQLKTNLERRVASQGLDNVIFMKPVTKDKVPVLMKGADVGLQILMNVPVFHYGTSPNKFFDYIAAGLPVLVNYPGWIADMISQNHCGFVSEPGNAEAMADALERAQANKQDLRDMGNRAAALAAKDFDRDKLANRLIEWLEQAETS
jgi:glycosyltransferase involved in cell wall biosynthesis